MPKNFVVIAGSARNGGNSELFAKSFIDGAVSQGHAVTLFEAGKKNLTGCVACEICFSRGQACSFDDDFNEIAGPIENADIMVFCSPLYWFSYNGQLKIVIDELYSFDVAKRPTKVKEAILISCSAYIDMALFDGLVKSYELILNDLDWKDLGQLLVPGVRLVGDVIVSGGLGKAKLLGLGIK
ncbi:MAG: flavodoxin family protein [Deltaproteobacteria bacterium]|nr:flavodoxin family protein [Deltaproteobacteria bacterium]